MDLFIQEAMCIWRVFFGAWRYNTEMTLRRGIGFVGLALMHLSASACDRKELMADAPVVVIGAVVGKQEKPINAAVVEVYYDIQVARVLKGDGIPNKIILRDQHEPPTAVMVDGKLKLVRFDQGGGPQGPWDVEPDPAKPFVLVLTMIAPNTYRILQQVEEARWPVTGMDDSRVKQLRAILARQQAMKVNKAPQQSQVGAGRIDPAKQSGVGTKDGKKVKPLKGKNIPELVKAARPEPYEENERGYVPARDTLSSLEQQGSGSLRMISRRPDPDRSMTRWTVPCLTRPSKEGEALAIVTKTEKGPGSLMLDALDEHGQTLWTSSPIMLLEGEDRQAVIAPSDWWSADPFGPAPMLDWGRVKTWRMELRGTVTAVWKSAQWVAPENQESQKGRKSKKSKKG